MVDSETKESVRLMSMAPNNLGYALNALPGRPLDLQPHNHLDGRLANDSGIKDRYQFQNWQRGVCPLARLLSGIELLTQTVPDEVEREHRQSDYHSGKDEQDGER